MDDLTELLGRVSAVANHSFFTLGNAPVSILSVLQVLLFLLAAWWISKVIRLALSRQSDRGVLTPASVYALDRIVHYLVIFVGFVMGLSAIGVDFTTFTVIAGALGIGVGLGLQQLVANFVAGIILLLERSLKVGDYVELQSGVRGVVRQINIRSTLVTSNDNIDILIPNSEFVQNRVINWTLTDDECRIHVPFRVAYGSDKALVQQAALEAAAAVPGAPDSQGRTPSVWLTAFGDSSLEFELLVWLGPEQVRTPARIVAAYTWALHDALERHGLEIPLPQREVRMLGPDPAPAARP